MAASLQSLRPSQLLQTLVKCVLNGCYPRLCWGSKGRDLQQCPSMPIISTPPAPYFSTLTAPSSTFTRQSPATRVRLVQRLLSCRRSGEVSSLNTAGCCPWQG